MKLANLIDQLAEISSTQWGMFTTSQAKAIGVTPQQLARLANLGRTTRVRHGIYLMESARPDRYTNFRAAWLAMDPTLPVADRLKLEDPGIFCGRSAAFLHGLGNATANDLELAFGARKQSRQRDVTYRLRKYTMRDWMFVGGIPVTKPLVTVRDHATGHVDRAIMLDVMRSAQSHPRINATKLKSIAETYCKYYGFSNGTEFLQSAREFDGEAARNDFLAGHLAATEAASPSKEFDADIQRVTYGSPKTEVRNAPVASPAPALVGATPVPQDSQESAAAMVANVSPQTESLVNSTGESLDTTSFASNDVAEDPADVSYADTFTESYGVPSRSAGEVDSGVGTGSDTDDPDQGAVTKLRNFFGFGRKR
ncbi:type IV toxin-antitoxin system AbiEi family antitoxin domain-containing protein [Micrococcales bacterium 31B]|nr:type IV toxin-antitoxin system AbiEi family antitoxin domain-containing protein [Micrococcales bacterium 31B]